MRTDGARGATGATTVGLLTATGAETLYDTTIIIHYAIGGKGERKAAVTDGASPTTQANGNAIEVLNASEGCVFVWTLKLDGTVGVLQSAVKSLDASNAFPEPDGIPDFPDVDLGTYCPFAYMVVKNGSTGSNWTFGSSNWNATGITLAIQDVLFGLPARPQSS